MALLYLTELSVQSLVTLRNNMFLPVACHRKAWKGEIWGIFHPLLTASHNLEGQSLFSVAWLSLGPSLLTSS